MLEVLVKEEEVLKHIRNSTYKNGKKNVNTTDFSFKAHEWQMVITIKRYKSKVINFDNDKTFEDQKAIKTIFNNQRLQNKNSWIYIF
jgi:hypothetical protein